LPIVHPLFPDTKAAKAIIAIIAATIITTEPRLYPFKPILPLMDEGRYGSPVHIWTGKEILDQPDAGIWFYGLVRQETAAQQ
jgi:hypothetical protein